jgi:hypothetical protein
MASVAIMGLLTLLAMTFDSVRVPVLKAGGVLSSVLLNLLLSMRHLADLVVNKALEASKRAHQKQGSSSAAPVAVPEDDLQARIEQIVSERLHAEHSFSSQTSPDEGGADFQKDLKSTTNRLRAEVAAAKQESLVLRQLRKEVETSLRQLRQDIEKSGEAKKEPILQLRSEVQQTNRVLARLDNELQRLDSKCSAQGLAISALQTEPTKMALDEVAANVGNLEAKIFSLEALSASQDAAARDLRARLEFVALEISHIKGSQQALLSSAARAEGDWRDKEVEDEAALNPNKPNVSKRDVPKRRADDLDDADKKSRLASAELCGQGNTPGGKGKPESVPHSPQAGVTNLSSLNDALQEVIAVKEKVGMVFEQNTTLQNQLPVFKAEADAALESLRFKYTELRTLMDDLEKMKEDAASDERLKV